MKISTNQFKNGTKLLLDGAPCSIIDHEFHKPGKGQAFSKIKFRNYLTGRVGEKTCKVGESIEFAGMAVSHLAMDPKRMSKSGKILMTADPFLLRKVI